MNLNGFCLDDVRRHNLKLIMHCLYEHKQSCKELSITTGLSETAIKKNIVQLLENNIVFASDDKTEGKKAVGRQHIRYEINPDFGHFLLIDFSYHRNEFAFTDICGNVKYTEKYNFNNYITTDELEEFLDRLETVIKENKFRIKEIAVSIPGQVDEETGVIAYSSRFDRGRVKNLKEIIANRFPNIEIFIKNDLRYSVYGDPLLAKRSENTVVSYFLIGYGIVSSFVKDEHIIQGINGISGEIGGLERIDGETIHNRCSIPELIKRANAISKCENLNDLLKLYDTNQEVHKLVLESAKYLAYDIDCITNALGSNNVIMFGETINFGNEYKDVIQMQLNKSSSFMRNVEFVDSKTYRFSGMVKKLQDHIIRCIM